MCQNCGCFVHSRETRMRSSFLTSSRWKRTFADIIRENGPLLKYHSVVFPQQDGWEFDYEGRRSFVTEVSVYCKLASFFGTFLITRYHFELAHSLTLCALTPGGPTCTNPSSTWASSSAALPSATLLTGEAGYGPGLEPVCTGSWPCLCRQVRPEAQLPSVQHPQWNRRHRDGLGAELQLRPGDAGHPGLRSQRRLDDLIRAAWGRLCRLL